MSNNNNTNNERRELTAAELDLVGGGAIFLEYEGVIGPVVQVGRFIFGLSDPGNGGGA